MRSNALILSLLVARAGTQSIWSYLPECAQSCAEEGVAAATNCDSTDYTCLCETHEFHLVSTCCVRASCDEEDDSLVFSESQSLCELYGVTITKIPDSECSSTFGVSASTATATATATTTGSASATAAETFTVTDTITNSAGSVSTLTFTYSIPAATATSSATIVSSSSGDSGSGSSSNDGSSGSSSSSNTSNNGKKNSALSKGAKIGIGVGAGVGGLAIIGGIVWVSVYCCCRRRIRNASPVATMSATPSGAAANATGDQQNEKANTPVVTTYNGNKTELDAQQLQQQRPVSVSTLGQTQTQHNPAVVPSSALPAAYAGPISPIARSDNSSSLPTMGSASELHSQQSTYYFQSPDGGAQELSGFSSYQYHPGVVTQAEMSADQQQQQHTPGRYELQ